MYNEILKDRIEAAILLSKKLKVQNSNSVVFCTQRRCALGYEIAKTYDYL
jgi:hypothetical protein